MVMSYDTWLKAKDLAGSLKTGLGTAAEVGIEAALIEIPIVGWLLAQAAKGLIGYGIDEILDMIPHEYPSGIGYKAGDTTALNRLLTSKGLEPHNTMSLTQIHASAAQAASAKAVPSTPISPFVSAPFGLGPRAAQPIPKMNRRAIRRATSQQRRILIRPVAQNPFSPGAIVPARIPHRQVSGI